MRLCLMRLFMLAFALVLTACAAVPESVSSLPWRDLNGDRGSGVRDRDWAQCADAVENHRSVLADCMARKGWAI